MSEQTDIQALLDRFKRTVPPGKDYQDRLAEEFEIILQQRFTDYFLKIRLILDLNKDIPHMTRGSAGSSLVCYLMGVTDVDPIEWNRGPAAQINQFHSLSPVFAGQAGEPTLSHGWVSPAIGGAL